MLRLQRSWIQTLRNVSSTTIRPITASASLSAKQQLPPRIQINDADVTISYLKGSGPGGQKINKTNSAVQIIHKPTGIVVKCQATRSRSQNQKMARRLLADKIEQQEKGDQSRVALKAEAGRKKKASKMKKARRKYRALENEEKDAEGREEAEEAEEGEEVQHNEAENEASEDTKSSSSA